MSNSPQTLSPHEELKAAQHRIWNNGDYGKIAWLTVPLAAQLVAETGVRAGSSVLDVATGTGHVAIEAARMFCDVTGIDYVDSLVEVARRRAEAEALPIAFEVADAEDAALRGRDFRCRALGDRRHVHRRPRPRCCRAGPGLPAWWTNRDGQLDGRRVHRPAAQDGHRPRAAAADRPSADAVGKRGGRARAARPGGHRRGLVDPRGYPALPLGGGIRRLHAHLLRPDLHRRPAPRLPRSDGAPRRPGCPREQRHQRETMSPSTGSTASSRRPGRTPRHEHPARPVVYLATSSRPTPSAAPASPANAR